MRLLEKDAYDQIIMLHVMRLIPLHVVKLNVSYTCANDENNDTLNEVMTIVLK